MPNNAKPAKDGMRKRQSKSRFAPRHTLRVYSCVPHFSRAVGLETLTTLLSSAPLPFVPWFLAPAGLLSRPLHV